MSHDSGQKKIPMFLFEPRDAIKIEGYLVAWAEGSLRFNYNVAYLRIPSKLTAIIERDFDFKLQDKNGYEVKCDIVTDDEENLRLVYEFRRMPKRTRGNDND